MRYKDLSYQRQSVKSSSVHPWVTKLILGVFGLGILIFGLKILFSPVVGAVASLWKESSTTLSFFVRKPEIVQENGVSNILLLGVDERIKGGTALTDTIILGSLRHTDQKMTLISIPRDLWVEVPGFGEVVTHYTKINSVYALGEQYGYPEGGVGLLQEVINKHFNFPTHYFLKINFVGFENLIDAVDGVDVYVENAFVDFQYPRTGYEDAFWTERWEILSFNQGWQHMDGPTALKYARSRHSLSQEGSDFARARRQQKILLALKEKILSHATLLNPNRLKELYLAFDGDIATNIGIAEIPTIYELTQQIEDSARIETYVLSTEGAPDAKISSQVGIFYVPDPNLYGGAYILLPREGWEAVQAFIRETVYGQPESQP